MNKTCLCEARVSVTMRSHPRRCCGCGMQLTRPDYKWQAIPHDGHMWCFECYCKASNE